MGKFDGVLLVSDYDDTFLHSGGYISRGNRAAVEYFQSAGGRFTLASGRPHTTMTPQVERNAITLNAPAVLANGAQVYDYEARRFLRVSSLRTAVADDLRAVMDALPGLSVLAYHGEFVYICEPGETARRHMARMNWNFSESPLHEVPQPWYKAILHGDYEVLLNAQRLLTEQRGEWYEVVFSNRALLELTDKGCTKGGSLLWMAGQIGISREHIYCVGDNQNDLPMLAVAAIPFAPDNCVPEVRESGARLVRACDDDAIAAVIEILDGMYEANACAR